MTQASRPPTPEALRLTVVGVIRSALRTLEEAPKQGPEGAPDAWIELEPWALAAAHGLSVGDEVLLITWLGLHPVFVRAIEGTRLQVGPIEAIDGTPLIDIKPVLK